MKRKWKFLVVLACLFAIPAAAKETGPRVEVTVDYSYQYFTTIFSHIHSRTFNGGTEGAGVSGRPRKARSQGNSTQIQAQDR